MGVCAGIKRDGTRCTVGVSPGVEWCYNHDPARQAERRRNAARGGKARASGELAGIKQRLSDLADDVLEEKVDKGVAAVASQVLNVYLRAVSMEMKLREVEELERRMDEIEALVAARRERPWGA